MTIQQDQQRYMAPSYQSAYEATGRKGVLVFAPDMQAFQQFCARHPGEAHAAVYANDVKRLMGVSLDQFMIAQVDGYSEHPKTVELEDQLRVLMATSTTAPYFLETGVRFREGMRS